MNGVLRLILPGVILIVVATAFFGGLSIGYQAGIRDLRIKLLQFDYVSTNRTVLELR